MRKASQTRTLNVNEFDQGKNCQHECCRDKEHNVQLCKMEDIKIDEEFVFNYTYLEKQILIVASGS